MYWLHFNLYWSVDIIGQYDLYLAVFLNEHKKNVLVPDYWCDTFNLAESINSGLNSNRNHLIFYSPDHNKVPDFTHPIRRTLNLEADGCYIGKVIRAFSK